MGSDTHITLGRATLDVRSGLRTDLYLTTHNIHKRQTFKPGIPASKLPQTQALDRATARFDIILSLNHFNDVYTFQRSFEPTDFCKWHRYGVRRIR